METKHTLRDQDLSVELRKEVQETKLEEVL